jgi:hypothetical protein
VKAAISAPASAWLKPTSSTKVEISGGTEKIAM